MMRSCYCGEINTSLIDQEIELCGWVHRRRDHGGVIFIDLRDREGLAQIVFDPDRPEPFAIADAVRNEYVIRISGRVRHRPLLRWSVPRQSSALRPGWGVVLAPSHAGLRRSACSTNGSRQPANAVTIR